MMCTYCHKKLHGSTWKGDLQKLSSNFGNLNDLPS